MNRKAGSSGGEPFTKATSDEQSWGDIAAELVTIADRTFILHLPSGFRDAV
jgi:hypothetical protein